jgi:ornithine cyclodeaminase
MTEVYGDEDIPFSLMPLAIDAVEEAFRARAAGQFVAPSRHNSAFGEFGSLVFTIGGTLADRPLAGFRVYDTFSGEQHTQIVAVWSVDSAKLEAVVLGERLGNIRTGAIGGVAIKYMSAKDAGDIGIIGSGAQARTQLLAAAHVRKLRSVKVFSPDVGRCAAFAAEMRPLVEADIRPVGSAAAAAEGSDIVICATSSGAPILKADWLMPGVHVNTVGPKTKDGHELDLDVAQRAQLIATDFPEQTKAYGSPFFLEGFREGDCLIDLAQIVTGAVAGGGEGDSTLFCSVGLAGTEVLVAERIISAIRQRR